MLDIDLLRKLFCNEASGEITESEIRTLETISNMKCNDEIIEKNDNFMRDSVWWGEYLPEVISKNDSFGPDFSAWIKKNCKMNVTEWVPNNPLYPRFMFLGTDKGILAYIEFFYHDSKELVNDNIICKYGICHEMSGLKNRIALVDSHLDRPVFYIHFINYQNYKGIYFETTEMIKNKIFEKDFVKESIDDKEYYFSELRELGSLEELIIIFTDLKKNNVKFY